MPSNCCSELHVLYPIPSTVTLVFLAKFCATHSLEDSQRLGTRFDFSISTRGCDCLCNRRAVNNDCGKYFRGLSIDGRYCTRFQAVVAAQEFRGQLTVKECLRGISRRNRGCEMKHNE